MTNGDIILVLILAGAFLMGYIWGTMRTLMFLVGGAFVFLVAAHLRAPLQGFLSREWTNLTPAYNDMLAALIVYVAGLLVLAAIVAFGTRQTGLWAVSPRFDRLVGGLTGVACAVLVVASTEAILGLFYGYTLAVVPPGGSSWSLELYDALLTSQVGGAIHRSLLPVLGAAARLLLPSGMPEAFGAG